MPNLSFVSPTRNSPWGTYLSQIDAVEPYLGHLSRWVETLRRPNFTDVNPTYSLTGDLTNLGYGSGTAGTATSQRAAMQAFSPTACGAAPTRSRPVRTAQAMAATALLRAA